MEKVSLYIPCFNAAAYLRRCLTAVFAQTYPLDEVIVVDDGSTDATADIALEFPVNLIKHSVNKGLAASRNTAVRAARNPLVAALDADCLPNRNWLEILVGVLADAALAGCAGKLEESNLATVADRWRSYYLFQHLGDKTIANPPLLFGSNILFRKGALIDIGLYNERFKTNYEDADLTRRLLQKGYRLFYEPKALTRHIRRDCVASVLVANWRWNFYGYTAPVTFVNTLKSPVWVFRRVRKYMAEDLRHRRLRFLAMDVLLLFCSAYLNFKYYITRRP